MEIKSTTKKIILDFNEDAANNIDNLKERLGLKSRTELFRYALALLDLTEEKRREGYKLQFRKGNSVTEVATLF